MTRTLSWLGTFASLSIFLATPLAAQDDVHKRLDKLEKENRELRESISKEIERLQFGSFVPALGDSQYRMGPAASKVYNQEEGLSVGGYGEFLYTQRSGNSDVFDAQRAILYFGYRFDENWLFNSEIEFEHGSTSTSSGTTTSGGSASVEFSYLEYLHSDSLNFRAGLLLVPMGLINEMHEPTTYLAASRPLTEQRILPTTWRENGAGAHGKLGDFEYSAYAITSLNGEKFSKSGVRGGRQKGNRAAADDFAFVGRLDWEACDCLTIGASVFFGDTGHDGIDTKGKDVPDMQTTILEVHAELRAGGLVVRGLYATADIHDTEVFNANTDANVAKRMTGYYGEIGYDLMTKLAPTSGQALLPFVRWESINTQDTMAAGFTADPMQDETVLTFGLHYRPIDNVVIKADFQSYDKGDDRFELLFGYIF